MVYVKKGRQPNFFDNTEKAYKATKLLKEGYSFNKIARELGCGNETVSKFYRKLIDSGIVINRPPKYVFYKEKKVAPANDKKIKKYVDYLKIENDKLKEVRRQRKEDARKNIEMARKNRKKEEGSVKFTGTIIDQEEIID